MVLKRWKEHFEKLLNEENAKEQQTEEAMMVDVEVESISEEEAKRALKNVQEGKAVGPNSIPTDVWKCVDELRVNYLTRLFDQLLEDGKMP